MTLADVVRELRGYDEEPVSWQEPTIYVAEPWKPTSEAMVAWSTPKGGLPPAAAKKGLLHVIAVRAALQYLGDEYDRLTQAGRVGELCEILVRHVLKTNDARPTRKRSDV